MRNLREIADDLEKTFKEQWPAMMKRCLGQMPGAKVPNDETLREWSDEAFETMFRLYCGWWLEQSIDESGCRHRFRFVKTPADPKCEVCWGSGKSYWSDGISGSCLECRGPDGGYVACSLCGECQSDSY